MKMGAGVFWGIVLILIGLGLIIKIIFNIDIPVFKFVIAFLFILIGIRMLFGTSGVFHRSHHSNNSGNVIFSESRIKVDEVDSKEYNVLFGKADFDLRDLQLSKGRNYIEINTVFGNAQVFLSDTIPVKIQTDVAFGGISTPEGNSGGFGSTVFTSNNFDNNSSYLYIKASAVFGGMNFKYR